MADDENQICKLMSKWRVNLPSTLMSVVVPYFTNACDVQSGQSVAGFYYAFQSVLEFSIQLFD